MAYSYVRYTGNGSTTNYTFSFPTISTDHIKVRVNGTLVTNWSFLSASTIQFAAAPANAAIIEIRRETPKDSSIVNFTDGSVLLERDLDLLATYDLYLAQETEDDLEDTIRVDSQGRFDALNKRIINVADPVAAQDAVTKNWLETTYTSELDAISLAAASSATAAAGSATTATTQATNATASAVSAANSAAAAATALDNFDDRYLGQKASDPAVDNDGNALITGALYYNTTDSAMRVYTGTGWINASSAQVATMKTYVYVATASQTTFTGNDANGSSLTYVAPYLIVSLNGLELRPVVDYTATSGLSVVLTTAATAGDELQVQAFSAFNVANIQSANVSFQQGGTGSTVRSVDSKLKEVVSVKDFGAVGDGVADDTAAIQAAIDYGLTVGCKVIFTAGTYVITDTITLSNSVYVKSFGMYGQNGNSTRIYFQNAISLKNMFLVDTDVNYLTVSDLEFIDNSARTSRCFYFADTVASSSPTWKHLFQNVRITAFKEGVRFDGGATIVDDAHCSEVMFLHSKTRNCETGLVYNNTQAVNHQLIGFDMENDAEGVSDEWTHIKMERGTTINHLGGSVIGKGPYLSYLYSIAGGFQDTSQFASKGIRVEKRGGTSPIISHGTASTITVSNSLRIIIDDMQVSASGGATLFARFGGRSFAKFQNVHANVQMDVEAYMTTNLSANGLYGSIVMEDCQALNYKRVSTVTAYGSAGVAATNYRSIPAQISYKNEGEQFTVDGSGYVQVSKPEQTIYSGSWETAQIKTLVYVNVDNAGFGSGSNPATGQINLPLYGRPCKFRLLRDDVNAGSAFQLDLIAVVSGVDYTVASITPTANVGGHFEANIQTATGLTYFFNDGVNWDGKMKVVKSGTVNGFVGLIMIDYM